MFTLSIDQKNKLVIIWLISIVILLFCMVIIGGVTRLTHSGLSMVEWHPITGWLPPLTETAWQETFSKYKLYPEYKKLNFGMTLDEFKEIFWFEFIHRVWGRIIGLVFFLPFVMFWWFDFIKRNTAIHLIILLVLGGSQAILGWFMVKSGMVDRPDVSQYRLASHLCVAFFIFGYLLWLVHKLLIINCNAVTNHLCICSRVVTVTIFITVFSGALVAGLDAGLVYNTFPLMDGDLIPAGWLSMTPKYLNFFENIITVQFDHRVLAILTLFLVFLFWATSIRTNLSWAQRISVNILFCISIFQVILGISTLIYGVPVFLAALHQGSALVLFGVSVWVSASFHRPLAVSN